MDLGYLFQLLLRRLWLIGAVGLIAALLTYWLVGKQAVTYQSSAIMSTGIINYKGINTSKNEGFVQEYMINNAFSNLMDFAVSRSNIKLLEIALLRHDLEAIYGGNGQPFRQPNKELSNFTEEEAKSMLVQLRKINLDSITDTDLSFSEDFDNKLFRLSAAFGYDHDALLNALTIERKGNTDYLNITARTNSPEFSTHLANTYANTFINYYGNLYLKERRQNVEFYRQLVEEKRYTVDSIQSAKFDYLYRKGLPVLDRQSADLIGTLSSLEADKRKAEYDARVASETMARLNQYLDELSISEDKESTEAVREKAELDPLLQQVQQLRLEKATAKGSGQGIDDELEAANDELEKSLKANATRIGVKKTTTKKALQDELYRNKIEIDLDRVEAETKAERIAGEIEIMEKQLGSFVLNDAVKTNFDKQQERAENEFAKVNNEMVQAKLELQNAENPLSLIENASPGVPESQHRSLIAMLAGLVCASLAAGAIMFLAFADRSVRTPDLFLKKTNGMHLLGSVAMVRDTNFDVRKSFVRHSKSPTVLAWQEHIRKLRNAIKPYQGDIFLITSPRPGEGKTFLLASLAHAVAANNQRVLIIDTNFKAPMDTALSDQPSQSSEMINKLLVDNQLEGVFKPKEQSSATSFVDVLGHFPISQSPSEVLPSDGMKAFLDEARKHYNYIFIESASMNAYVDSREMMDFADHLIMVFSAKKPMDRSTYETIAYLKETQEDKLIGSVLNKVDPRNLT